MIKKEEQKERRKKRTKKNIYGTEERPRLTVFRSLKYIYAQIIKDDLGCTLVSSSSLDKEIKDQSIHYNKKESAKKVGEQIAKKAKEKGITKVVFDRGSFSFSGRVKALGEAAREGGLEF